MCKLILSAICIIIIAGLFLNDIHHQHKCLTSIYKTTDYKIEDGVFYCRSSDDSYQKLTRPKIRSPHLDEHFKEKGSE